MFKSHKIYSVNLCVVSAKDLQLSAVVVVTLFFQGKGLGGTLSFSRGSRACALEDKSVAWNKEDALYTSHEL